MTDRIENRIEPPLTASSEPEMPHAASKHLSPASEIPPMAHPETEPMLRWFDHQHLPNDLAAVSSEFGSLARLLARHLPRSPERTVALRKLLESKDAAVRCALLAREA